MLASGRTLTLPVVGQFALTAVFAATLGAQPVHSHHGNTDAAAMKQMSHDAVQMLNDTGNAANALSSGNKPVALTDLNMAITQRDKLAATANAHNLPQVIPIFTELEQGSVLDTVVTRKNNGKAMPPKNAPVTVDGAADQFTFIGVDLDRAKARLLRAKSDIDANNIQGANTALGSIGDDFVVEKVTADAPLLAIRENLGLAQAAAMDHRYNEATAALKQASTELTSYAKMAPSSKASLASGINNQIGRMLVASAQNEPQAAVQIGQWWVQVNDWMKSPHA